MFKAVHALRGIAALWVVLFHASAGGHVDDVKAVLPAWLNAALFEMGDNGVAIFFALSGFVIAHSLRNTEVTPGFVGRFALRRSVRLDPPYWAAIALAVSAAFASAAIAGAVAELPTGASLAAHVLYLQTLLGFDQINTVFWTLTYEVQFYLVLVILLGVAQRFGAWWALVPMFAAALIYGTGLIPETVPGLFLNLWHTFFMGVLAYLGITSARAAVGASMLAAALLLAGPSAFTLTAVVTALALLIAGRAGYLKEGMRWPALQWLGTISYSLYLTHNPVTGAAFTLCRKIGLSEWLALPLVVAICLAFASAFWWVLERPSQALAKRVSLKPAPAAMPASAA